MAKTQFLLKTEVSSINVANLKGVSLTEKITVGIDTFPSLFGMKSKLLGANGEHVKYIEEETGAVISLRGKGSGYLETPGGKESTEQLHILVKYLTLEKQDEARQLVLHLIETVQRDFLDTYGKMFGDPEKPQVSPVHPWRENIKPSSPFPPKRDNVDNSSGPVVVEKILLGLDHVPPTFNLKKRIYGLGLSNVQRIGKATNALVLVEGNSHSFDKDNELAEPACVIVKYLKPELKDVARRMVLNLIDTIQLEYVALYGSSVEPRVPEIIPLQNVPSASNLSALSLPSKFLKSTDREKSAKLSHSPTESTLSRKNSPVESITRSPVPPPPPVISKTVSPNFIRMPSNFPLNSTVPSVAPPPPTISTEVLLHSIPIQSSSPPESTSPPRPLHSRLATAISKLTNVTAVNPAPSIVPPISPNQFDILPAAVNSTPPMVPAVRKTTRFDQRPAAVKPTPSFVPPVTTITQFDQYSTVVNHTPLIAPPVALTIAQQSSIPFYQSVPSPDPIPVKPVTSYLNQTQNFELNINKITSDVCMNNGIEETIALNFENEIELLLNRIIVPGNVVTNMASTIKCDLITALRDIHFSYEIHLFGSGINGLMCKGSDFDFCFSPSLNTLTVDELAALVIQRLKRSFHFNQVFRIKKYNVPLIKFVHKATKKHCDMSFCNEIDVRKGLLVKFYLTVNSKLKPLVLFLKFLLQKHDLLGRGRLRTYILFWLAVFYMQQSDLLPSVMDARQLSRNRFIVKGWDCSVPQDFKVPVSTGGSVYSHVMEFFKFYSDFQFMKFVISPYLARAIPIDCYKNVNRTPDSFSEFLNQVEDEMETKFCAKLMNVQDATIHNENIARGIDHNSLNKFKLLCHRLLRFSCTDINMMKQNSIINSLCTLSLMKSQPQQNEPLIVSGCMQYIKLKVRINSASQLVKDAIEQQGMRYLGQSLMTAMHDKFKCTVKYTNVDDERRINPKINSGPTKLVHVWFLSCSVETSEWKKNVPSGVKPEPMPAFLSLEMNKGRKFIYLHVSMETDAEFLRVFSQWFHQCYMKEVLLSR